MMGADEPGFDVAEQGMDDREEFAGVGALALDHRHMLQMLAEIGVATTIAGKPIGQQMRTGREIGLEKGAEFGTRGGRQHGDAGAASKEAMLALDGMSVLSLLVLWRRHFFDGGDDKALVGVLRAAATTIRIAAAADEGLVRLKKAVQRMRWAFAQPVAQLVRHGPGRLIRHPQLPLQKLGRDAALVAAIREGARNHFEKPGRGRWKTLPARTESF